jgi:N-acyl-D-aspartate/D-glutamate deacylase
MILRSLLPVTILAVIISSCQTPESDHHFELVIKGGNVLDGNGGDPFIADIGINMDTITYIGGISDDQADSIIDVSGLEVAPGFIDLHTHLGPIMRIPDATSHLMQGATTALGGPDGGGPWPFGEYLDSLDNIHLGMNVAYLVGHNTVRRTVMGLDNRSPDSEELEEMKSFISQAMQEGAFGISTGLKYLPGAFSEIDEVIELSKVASESGGIYTSHLREEGLGLLQGVQEAIIIGAEAKIPVILTHHKAIGKPMWGASVKTLAMIDSARNLGIDVMADQYPYTASYTSLSILIPAWAMAGGQDKFEKRINDPVLKDSILNGTAFNIINDRAGDDLRRVQFSRTPWDSTLSGKTLHDWAIKRGLESNARNGAELVLEAQMAGGGTAIYHAIDDEDVKRIMSHPMTMIASDGRLVNMGEGWPHPRWYGTFPKVLGHYTREEGVLDLPTAIMKMSSMPADRLGLEHRGRLMSGNYADIVIFDADSIADMASFEDPHHYPKGIHYVIVNGELTVFQGEMRETRSGRVLRGPGWDGK